MLKSKGFTLIELLIVIAIVGILAAAILPRFTSFNLAARDATTRSNLAALRGALIQYRASEGDWPANLTALQPVYIEKIPGEFLTSASGCNVVQVGASEAAGYSNTSIRNDGAPGWYYGNYAPASASAHGRSVIPNDTIATTTSNNDTNTW